MTSCEGIGKTIEKAIENALLDLKAKREDVDIKILEEGGLFKKAKVLVSISDDSIDKYEKKEKKKNESDEKLDVKAMFADLKIDNKKEDKKPKEEEKTKEDKLKEEEPKPKKERVPINESGLSGKEFIEGVLKELKIEANVFSEEKEDSIIISLEGGNCGDLIGYRGECLNALQYVASIIENNVSRKRLILDIEKYRSRREDSLKSLARRIESKVIKTNKSVRLEPMNANERRIIHTELQDSEKVTTISKGMEPGRFVVVVPKREKNAEEEKESEE